MAFFGAVMDDAKCMWRLRRFVNPQQVRNDIANFSLDLVGIVMLANLDSLARFTALRGTASLFDAFAICPGAHKQQEGPDLAKGEYPACAAMTSGYVFRVENEATVVQLQRLGKPGCLTTLKVRSGPKPASAWSEYSMHHLISEVDFTVQLSYLFAILAANAVWMRIAVVGDFWGLFSLSLLILCRLVNIVIIQRRARLGWKGALEPGVQGDLLILLSQDRWIRMRGFVDDLKAVTSGQWLREPTFIESSLMSCTTLLVYVDIVFWKNALSECQGLFLMLLLVSAACMGICNHFVSEFRIYDKIIAVDGEPKKYQRRLDLADELIKETGRKDWAIRLGMVQGDKQDVDQGPKTM